MFVGHYAPGFGLRHASGGVPLWVLFLAAQFLDLLWSILIICGVEKVRITPGFTATSPLDLYYMPYSHSLAASVAWALLLGWLASLIWSRRSGIVVGVCVFAHWFLDLLVHVPDLPLWGDVHKVGFGLWDRPVLAFALEVGVLFIGAAMYAKRARSKTGIWVLALIMVAIQMTSFVVPPPEGTTEFAVMGLSSCLVFTAAAWFVEKKSEQGAGA